MPGGELELQEAPFPGCSLWENSVQNDFRVQSAEDDCARGGGGGENVPQAARDDKVELLHQAHVRTCSAPQLPPRGCGDDTLA
ncbi:hypothetical protein WJX73_010130 [Symbiochloris irregularis]|uniref:Uncharacterized protein n=1 Tax=Symbiochloris irregularis TaxID=706552 RepID=A0AAW1NNT1_9CHLO